MLNAYFKGNLIAEWDTIFYTDIAPLVFEKILDQPVSGSSPSIFERTRSTAVGRERYGEPGRHDGCEEETNFPCCWKSVSIAPHFRNCISTSRSVSRT